MIQFLIRLSDRIYDKLNYTETARAWDQGKCVAVLRLPKGYCGAIGELADLMSEHAPDDIEFVADYEN